MAQNSLLDGAVSHAATHGQPEVTSIASLGAVITPSPLAWALEYTASIKLQITRVRSDG